jgi:hypothetical protein
MDYYLKYLKYKQKYLDLKYNDLEGGKYGLKTFDSEYNLEGMKYYEKENFNNMEDLAIIWNKEGSTTSYSTTPNPKTNKIQPGYYFNFNFINSSNPIQSNAPSLDAPPLETPSTNTPLSNKHDRFDDFKNHIHVISVENINDNYKVRFTLKVNGLPLKLDDKTIEKINKNFDYIKGKTDIKEINKYLPIKNILNIAPDIKDKKNLAQYIYEKKFRRLYKKVKNLFNYM